jgi:hypothetical protein
MPSRAADTKPYLGLLLFCYFCILDWQVNKSDCQTAERSPEI